MKLSRGRPTKPGASRKLALFGTAPDKRLESLEHIEHELKQARDYAQAIVETVPPLLVLDADLRVKTANDSFYKHFRVAPPETQDCLVYDLGNGQWNIPKLRTFLEEILPRHSFFRDFEVTHEFEGIGRRTVLLSGHQVAHLQRILLFINDITERKRTEQELLDAKNEIGRHAAHLEQEVTERTRQLRETIGELESFSYSVSHDMRAPLRAMQSFAQFLVDDYGSKLDEQGVNYLHQIMRSAVRLDQLIRDVLSYTKILHSPLPMETVDLDRLVRDIIETYPNGQPIQPQIQVKGKLPKVLANEALLTQCVSNLLSNGAKFVSPGTTPRLEISAEDSGPSLARVWIKDNGIGIAPENHGRIFRLFERIHPATEYEGTGIGLTIVRKAIERMGAQVGFESELGKGSKFWMQLEKG